MSLREVVATVRGRGKTLTVYRNHDTGVVAELREYFASQNVAIEKADADGDPEHAVLSDGDEFLAAVGIDALRGLTSGSPREVGESTAYSRLLSHLDRTTFTSYDRRQMVEASREIEDRAWRSGSGRLYAGFQRASNFTGERETYARLAEKDLDVHVYGLPDVSLDVPDGVTFHGAAIPDVASSWFVVFDGGDDPRQACALLSVQRGEGFYGFWTYDAGLVDEALAALGAARTSA